MSNDKLSILIVDDHKMFLDGIYEILRTIEEYEVIGSVKNGIDAIEFIKQNRVDLVITDLRMKRMDGMELTKYINTNFPGIKILMVSMHNDPQVINELLKNGITGYILKSSGKKELIHAIEEVSKGNTFFSEEIKSSFINSKVINSNLSDKTITLTRREKEVLELIAKELTTGEIAESLFISLNTVETHRKNILKKLQVRNSVGIVKKAMQLGMLE